MVGQFSLTIKLFFMRSVFAPPTHVSKSPKLTSLHECHSETRFQRMLRTRVLNHRVQGSQVGV